MECSWKTQFVSASLCNTAVVGFITARASVAALFDKLVVQENVLKYILTYNMSQDHLELFFSAVRSREGGITTRQPCMEKTADLSAAP